MGFSTKFGSFNTGTAAAGNTVAVTGVGFQPKQIFMWWVGRTETTDAVGRANTLLGFGAANSPTERYCTTQYSLDAAATSDGGLLASSTACVQVCDGAGASAGALDHQSMDAGGFTLVVDVQFAASYRVHYLALGGADLTNYKLGTMTAPTSTGNLAYTGVGFQPDLVLMFINGINGGIGGSSSRQPIHIGAAKSSSSRWTVSAGQDDGSGTMDAYSYANDIECVGIINAVGGATPEAQADFVSMDADGFTLNWTRVFASTARGGWYLALKGGQYALGSVLTKTDTTTDIVVSGLGFSPVGGLVVSHNQAENAINTATANANMSIGGFDSATSRGAVAYMDQNGLADSEVTTAVEHDEVYANVDGGALLGLMDVKSVDAGGVTFIMDDADPAQAFATYLLFGSSGITATVNQTSETDTAQAITHAKYKAVAQVTETDTAQSITPSKQKAVGQVAETDSAQVITAQSPYPLAQASEVDTAQPISWAPKNRLVGQASETDLAQTVSARKNISVAQTSETDTAQPISWSPKNRLVGQASETDTAQAVGKVKNLAVGQTTETDSAQSLSHVKNLAVGQVSETDLAQAIGKSKTAGVGIASETDSAQSINPVAGTLVAQANETDLAQTITPAKYKAVAQASETETAQAISASKTVAVSQASEIDTAQSFGKTKQILLGQPSETDLAQSISISGATAVAQVTETDIALPFTVVQSGIPAPVPFFSTKGSSGPGRFIPFKKKVLTEEQRRKREEEELLLIL